MQIIMPPLAAVILSYSEALADFPVEAFPHRPQCVIHRSLELICVAVACLISLFLNVHRQTEFEEVKIGDCGGQNFWVKSSC